MHFSAKLTATCILIGMLSLSIFSATSDLYKIKGSTKLLDGTPMVYRLFVPPTYDSKNKYPLVVILHGNGEKGSDGNNQLNNGPIGLPWIADSVQKKWAPFALAPQCPVNHSFSTNGTADMGDKGIVKIIDSLVKVYSIDTTRLYVGGHSFGGVGTLGLMASYPKKFAAAVPCAANGAGPYTTLTIDSTLMVQTPFWAFNGDADTVIPIAPMRKTITSVENLGNKVVRFYSSARMTKVTGISVDSLANAIKNKANYLYTEIKDADHGIACEEGWRCPLLVSWLFSKAKIHGETVNWPLETSVNPRHSFYGLQSAKGRNNLLLIRGKLLSWNGTANVTIRVFSANGIMAFSKSMGSKETVMMSTLCKGVYIAELGNNGSGTCLKMKFLIH